MPSPIESTVPVSATSISRPYSLISRFRMSVISPGLMSIGLVLIERAAVAAREAGAELTELRAQAAVEDEVADLRDGAADERGVDRDLELDLPPVRARERAPEPRRAARR